MSLEHGAARVSKRIGRRTAPCCCLCNPPVQELDDGERRGVGRRRGDPVESSLPDVDEVQIFVSLQEQKQKLTIYGKQGLFFERDAEKKIKLQDV